MEKPQGRTYKRRTYFIEKSFQAKFILKFCALVAIGGLLTIRLLYILAMQSTTVSIVNSRVVVRTIADFILPILIQTVVIVTIILSIVTVIVTLFISHKIAGPLYRFKKIMKELEEGNFSQDFQIRRLDQLQDLAVAFNNMIKKTRDEIKSLKDDFSSLRGKVDGILEHEVPEHKRLLLRELKNISEQLDKALRYFKT
jgi:methyl-accepting chemotaxis protein